MKRLQRALALSALGGWVFLSLAGCNLGRQEARVECKNDPPHKAFQCTVKHTKGKKRLNVCWDVVVNCEAGNKKVGHACQEVDPKGTASRSIPYSEFTGACKQAKGVEVKNLKLKIL